MTSKNLSLEERPLLAVSSHILIRDWDAIHCSDRFSPSWEGWGTGGAVWGEVLSKQGGRRWSAPCRRLSKDARDPPHPGLGVFGARGSTHLLFLRAACGDYISQQARRRLPAWESWRRPSQPSQPSQPAPLRILPSGVGLLATQRVAFLELGSGPFRRKGRQPWLVAPSGVTQDTRGSGISSQSRAG